MRRSALPLALSFALLLAGCQSWNVNAFGVPVGDRTVYASVENSPPNTLGYHAEPKSEPLTKEEKGGVILIVGLAIAAIVVGIVAAS